jgi:hypothetical protein
MSKRLPVFLSCCLAGALVTSASAQTFTVTMALVPGQVPTGNATVIMEVFATNSGPDFNILAYQIDLPCVLPGKPGSTGDIRAQPAAPCAGAGDCPAGATCSAGVCNSTTIPNASAAASGSVPFMFAAVAPNDGQFGCGGTGNGDGCQGGLKPINQAGCRFAGTPNTGEPPYIWPAGQTRFLGQVRYRVSECATGTFNVPYEVMNMPCVNSDLTRLVNATNNCISGVNFVAGAITVPTGQCCASSGACITDGVNQVCCTNANPGAVWTAGRTCQDPCACTDNAQCNDGQFCNGAETCNLQTGQCVPGTPPVCTGGTQCANATCDPAANGGAGACVVVNKADGTSCSIGGEGSPPCDNPDTCMGGVCQENLAANGTACGNPGSGPCDNPDSCQNGVCANNNKPNGPNPLCADGNDCTDDVCQGGVCANPNDNTNTCSDGDLCTGPDRCVGGVCIGDPVNVDDGLVCTLDECDPMTGDIVHTDINTIGCLDDSDCPGVECVGGTCQCVEFPDCELRPQKDALGANCHEEGDKLIVDFFFGGTPSTLCIAGGSMRITYDPSCLDFQSADPGDVPWTNQIFEQVNEAAGVIFYAVGSPVGGGIKCTNEPGVMARFTFTKIGDCNSCNLCLTTVNPQHTRLTTDKGQEVQCAELGCSKPIYDAGDITATCPGNIDVNSDCNKTTAVVTWPKVSFIDECDGALDKNCTCVHQPLPNKPAINCNGLANSGGTFPQGTFTFTCTATDDNCNERETCSWTVNVSDQQTLDVHLQLSPIITPSSPKNPDGTFDRCICFELISSCTPLVKEEVCETVEFGGPWNFPGQADALVKMPKGKYVCIQARDRQHSLRATHFPLVCNGVNYTADFRGDPFFGGNWLIQGNLNRDQLIDILDFGTFLGQFNQNPNPGPDKACEDNNGMGSTHADFNGDGIVDVADYTFIQINFLANDKDDCCHDPSAGDRVGRTEITVKELREMGLGDLAVADLNADGVVNTDDMAAFVEGARPKTDKVNRGSVGRPTTIRGSK